MALDRYVTSFDEVVFDAVIKRIKAFGYPYDNAIVTKVSEYCYKIKEENLRDLSDIQIHEQMVQIREIQINELL